MMTLKDMDAGGLLRLLDSLGCCHITSQHQTTEMRAVALEALRTQAILIDRNAPTSERDQFDSLLEVTPGWLRELRMIRVPEESPQQLISNNVRSEEEIRKYDRDDLKSFGVPAADASRIFRKFHPLGPTVAPLPYQQPVHIPSEKPVLMDFDPDKMKILDYLEEFKHRASFHDPSKATWVTKLRMHLYGNARRVLQSAYESNPLITFDEVEKILLQSAITERDRHEAICLLEDSIFKDGDDPYTYCEKIAAAIKLIQPDITDKCLSLCLHFKIPKRFAVELREVISSNVDTFAKEFSRLVKSENLRRNQFRQQQKSGPELQNQHKQDNNNNNNHARRGRGRPKNRDRNDSGRQSQVHTYNTRNNPQKSDGEQDAVKPADKNACSYCKKEGHYRKNCPELKQSAITCITEVNQVAEEPQIVRKSDSPEFTVEFSRYPNKRGKLATGTLDTGADITAMRVAKAVELELPIFEFEKVYKEFNETRTRAAGFSYVMAKVFPGATEHLIKVILFNQFGPEMLLGVDFMRKTGIYTIALPDSTFGFYRLKEYGKPKVRFFPLPKEHLENIPYRRLNFTQEPKSDSKSSRMNTRSLLVEAQSSVAEDIIFCQDAEEKVKTTCDKCACGLAKDNVFGQNKSIKEVLLLRNLNDDAFPSNVESVEKTLKGRINHDLSENEQKKILTTLKKFEDRFSTHKYDLGLVPDELVDVKLKLTGPIPRCKERKKGPLQEKIIREHIAEFLKYGILENSKASGASPVSLVPKSDKSWRVVIDYRWLNANIQAPHYPIQDIDILINHLKNKKYYVCLDLSQGYYQIPLKPEERDKTTIIAGGALYRFTRLPMGISAGPTYFQFMIDHLLGELKYQIAMGYFDDIVVWGNSIDELCHNIEMVMKRLRKFNLKCRPDKCTFAVEELKFLGFVVSGHSIKPNPDKIAPLEKLTPATSYKHLESQLGFFNYFSGFVENYSMLAAPLYDILASKKMNIPFTMNEEHKRCWEAIRSALVKDCELAHFDPQREIKMTVDASSLAVGGILMQKENDEWRPIHYFSKKLSKHQLAYTITEKEALAVVHGVDKFRHYLEIKNFIIETDHCALCSLKHIDFKAPRIHRWAALLSNFNYTIKYKNGKDHLPDCSTRSSE